MKVVSLKEHDCRERQDRWFHGRRYARTSAGGVGATAQIRSPRHRLVVTDMAVIGFPNSRATLMETAPGVSVADVIANSEAELVMPAEVPQMAIVN
jgi:acyl CoA:acetate/3-ketoacid CoA transferase beta subunit